MRIRLIGQRNTSGIGTHYACFADALRNMHGIGSVVDEVDFLDPSAIDRAIATSQVDDINICFVAMPIHSHFHGRNIQWIVFESTRIPQGIRPAIQGADQVWVPSAWGLDVLLAHGVAEHRVHVVPEGVDGARFHAHGRRPRTSARPFRFLTVGKYEQRKGIDLTIEAFAQVYANQPQAELVIKSNYFTNHRQKYDALHGKISDLGLDNVTLLWGEMTEIQLADLYRACDIFVLPTRAEGWGLPLIEAVAAGLPVITTRYSGHMEFLQHVADSVLPVAHVMTQIDCAEYCSYYPDSTNDWGAWAEPDVDSIVTCMQQALQQEQRLYDRAQRNSAIIRKRFSWSQSAEQALQALCDRGWL
jgi:glycosyltransferase involved in cell wall biosynthesis